MHESIYSKEIRWFFNCVRGINVLQRMANAFHSSRCRLSCDSVSPLSKLIESLLVCTFRIDRSEYEFAVCKVILIGSVALSTKNCSSVSGIYLIGQYVCCFRIPVSGLNQAVID